MSPLLEEVQALIKNSLGLQETPAEQTFWMDRSEGLNEGQLAKLKEVLTQEASSRARMEKESAERMTQIDAQQLEELQNFKHKVLPQFLKEWETVDNAKENPEDILTQIPNA